MHLKVPRYPSFRHSWQWFLPLLLALTSNSFCANLTAPGAAQPDSIHLLRLGALYELADHFRDSLWPGFDIHKIPIAINNQDQQEYLIGHPNPPQEFHPLAGWQIGGLTPYLRDGCTLYGPRGGGWAAQVGGVLSAYVGVLQKDQTTDSYFSLLMHECFHVFQPTFHERADSAWGELPELDADYSAHIGLESCILHELVVKPPSPGDSLLASLFVAAREERRRNLARDVILAENETEFDEGTATYIQTRLLELLSHIGGLELPWLAADSQFYCFSDAGADYDQMIYQIFPAQSMVTTYMHARYNVGMAECLVLDRLEPGWKSKLAQKGVTQYDVLKARFSFPEAESGRLLQSAKAKFAYDSIYTVQHQLVTQQIDSLRHYLQADGRRYRIYYSQASGNFKWKPRGPVLQIPTDLMANIDSALNIKDIDLGVTRRTNHGPTLWLGGIERFEKGDLVFESKQVPILFRLDYFQWIDTIPAADESDFKIESSGHQGDLYENLKITTNAFVLQIPHAKITKYPGVIAILPETDATK
jgi:hypothetical protein